MGILKRLKNKPEDLLKKNDVAKSADAVDIKGDVKKQKKVVKQTKQTKKTAGKFSNNVIVRPLVTEKASILASLGQYIFEVNVDANRVQVRKSVFALYGVEPISVNIMNMRGKCVRFGRTKGKRKDWKKAVVTLPKGKTIDVYEGV